MLQVVLFLQTTSIKHELHAGFHDKVGQALLQRCTAFLYYKVGQIVLQSRTGITKYNNCQKVGQCNLPVDKQLIPKNS